MFGGRRHLALAGDLVHGRAVSWPSPFEDGIAAVLALRGRPVCVVASGDPFFYGVGATLARHVPANEMRVMPAPSAFSLAAARLGWALQDVVCLSVHGRSTELIRPHLHPGRHLMVLTSDGEGPAAVARLLDRDGFGASKMHVLEAIGGARERMRSGCAADLGSEEVDALNLVGIEVVPDEGARIIPLTPGLPDDCFENDGQLTKRDIRAVTLAALAPRRGELLWDIGAGAGSVAIEWMLADPSLRAVAVEERTVRAARVRSNAWSLGVPGLDVIEGRAPAALAGLVTPDAIFIGGGAGDEGVLDAAIAALRAGGRLIVNAVTLETEALLLAKQATLGGDLVRIAVSHAAPVGSVTGWRPSMPVTQWRWVKP
ncbi:MAG: precorrin-6y C5,15-methyltransferase (decarboxylating), CbiE subunit [Xanthobacteraceae bacterium]|nr:precorrin-6y C5,15-methyltransferase (decarboxylating), CbiE subunit [Xanthobacteraceae bacterium]